MSDVKRYYMIPDDRVRPEYMVLASDYDALASRLAAAEQARAGWQQQAIARTDDWRKCEIERDSLASRLAAAERALAAARRSNQDAADLLLTINRDMHARNPTAVTAIDMWLAERGCYALSPRHQSAEGAEGEGT